MRSAGDKRRAEDCPPYQCANSYLRCPDVAAQMALPRFLCSQLADARFEASRDL
jgi:hypothetical protein